MSCPVCDRTMQNLGSPDRRVWWCSGCGTLKEESGDFTRVELPADLRHVLDVAALPPAGLSVVTVDCSYQVRRQDGAQETAKIVIFKNGRRVW